jgi:hypothetical protein
MKIKIRTIPQKRSGSGTIHDIASEHHDRVIKFGPNCIYAVVLASYYGGKGYTTHQTEAAAIRASKRQSEYSHEIIDVEGRPYQVFDGELSNSPDYCFYFKEDQK